MSFVTLPCAKAFQIPLAFFRPVKLTRKAVKIVSLDPVCKTTGPRLLARVNHLGAQRTATASFVECQGKAAQPSQAVPLVRMQLSVVERYLAALNDREKKHRCNLDASGQAVSTLNVKKTVRDEFTVISRCLQPRVCVLVHHQLAMQNVPSQKDISWNFMLRMEVHLPGNR